MPLRLPASPARPFLRKMISAGLQAADPYQAVLRTIALHGSLLKVGRKSYDLSRYDRVIVVGAGKASARMAQAVEFRLKSRVTEGLVVVKTGHVAPTRRITIREAGHPIPNRAGIRAAAQLCALVAGCTARDMIIVLLSGGASSLLPAPVPGVTLRDKQRTTELLLRCGAAIHDMNTVRKHLSLLKGGGLAGMTKAAMLTLVLSDVIGDDLASIGSGPTVPDPTTYDDAIAVLRRYKIWRLAPVSVRRHLSRGRRGTVSETLKPGASRRRLHHVLIGDNRTMVEAVVSAAHRAGLRTVLCPIPLTGEAQAEARCFAEAAKRMAVGRQRLRRPCCVIAGGETTVAVTGRGKGGRAQEFAVAAALHIAGLSNVWVAAMGSDGTDGPTDVAGAVVNGDTFHLAQSRGMGVHEALRRHDSYRALKRLDAHIVTGPTGTNVNDLYLLLLL